MANYAESIFIRPDTGAYYSIVNGIARQFAPADQAQAKALAPNAQVKPWGQDTNGYDPQHQGGNTGGDWTSLVNFQGTYDTAQNQSSGSQSKADYASNPAWFSGLGTRYKGSSTEQSDLASGVVKAGQYSYGAPGTPIDTPASVNAPSSGEGAKIDTSAPHTPAPTWRAGLTDVQKNGVTALLGRIGNGTVVGGKPSSTDIANLTFALGPNWQQFVPAASTGGASGAGAGGAGTGGSGTASGDRTLGGGTAPDPATGLLNAIADQLTSNPPAPSNGAVEVDFAKYLDQAKAEVDPYYHQLIEQTKDDLVRGVTDIGTNLAANERTLGATYGKNLETTQENMASRGLASSSIRNNAERSLTDTTQAAIDAGRAKAASDAMDLGTTAERKIGSDNLPTLPGVNSAPTPILNQPGIYALTQPSTTRDLFTPKGGTTGTTQTDQITAEQTRARDLDSASKTLQANYTL